MKLTLLAAILGLVLAVPAGTASAQPVGRAAQAGAAPAFKSAAGAATRGRARSLRIRVPRAVAAGDVMVAAVTVRSGAARALRARRGWRRLRVTRSRRDRLTQGLYLRVAGGSEPSSYRWSFARRAGAAGGIAAYGGVDAGKPVEAHRAGLARPGRSRRVATPGLSLAVPNTRVLAVFGSGGRVATRPPAGSAERFDIASRAGVSAAGADLVRAAAGRTGGRGLSARRSRRRCRPARRSCRPSRRVVVQVVALRPAGAAGGAPGTRPQPGVPAGAAVPAPLPESTGTTFHVVTSGSDSNPGTAAQPWATVQKALDSLRPNQRAFVHAGTYTQALDLDRACTATGTCTVEAAPGEVRPVLRATDDHVLRVNGEGAYWRFRGFTFRDSDITSGGLVDLYGHHLEVSGSELTNSGDQGFYLDEASHHIQLLGNRMHDSGLGRMHQSHGAYLQGNDHFVANNLIYNHPYGFGIQVYDKGLRSVIVNNTITHNAHAGIVVGGSGGVSGVVIRNNILAYNSDYGIAWDSTCPDSSVGPTRADHNVLFGNGSGGIDTDSCPATDTSGGNRAADPLFANTAGRDLHLRSGSPAIGYALADWTPATDHDGEPRGQGGASDAGAYEDG